ncbi:MAG: hypothetical protein KC492_44470, partial [Myxococcales bacterium]|nr:hypothetical protein [Myxococcales bacterium]
ATKSFLGLLLLTLALFGLGCASVPKGAKTLISRNANCPEKEMRFKEYSEHIVNGDGCGQRIQVVLTCPYGETQYSGKCVWRLVNDLKEQRLKARASLDFKCDAASLYIKPADALSWGIEGCGQSATYLWHCPTRTSGSDISVSSYTPSYSDECTWVMNSAR